MEIDRPNRMVRGERRALKVTAELAETEGTQMNGTAIKGRELDRGRIEIEPDECKGCGLCLSACPIKGIQFSESLNAQGFRPAFFVARSCSGCGICFYVCPEPGAITIYLKSPSVEKHA